jgi:hypothetical protein
MTKHRILKDFHALLEIGPSHNSYNEDGSTRLMVKYQEYLIELKRYYYKMFGKKILKNLYKFPIYNIPFFVKSQGFFSDVQLLTNHPWKCYTVIKQTKQEKI